MSNRKAILPGMKKPPILMQLEVAEQAAVETINSGKITPTAGALSGAFPEWTADNGLQKANTVVQYKGVGYKCVADIWRYSNYAPDLAPNNYTPLPAYNPAYDAFEYVYRMSADVGMRVVDQGVVYECVQAIATVLWSPKDIPAIFKKI